MQYFQHSAQISSWKSAELQKIATQHFKVFCNQGWSSDNNQYTCENSIATKYCLGVNCGQASLKIYLGIKSIKSLCKLVLWIWWVWMKHKNSVLVTRLEPVSDSPALPLTLHWHLRHSSLYYSGVCAIVLGWLWHCRLPSDPTATAAAQTHFFALPYYHDAAASYHNAEDGANITGAFLDQVSKIINRVSTPHP